MPSCLDRRGDATLVPDSGPTAGGGAAQFSSDRRDPEVEPD